MVDARYCAPYATMFTVTETLLNDYAVVGRGAEVMRADKAGFGWFRRHFLLDISAASRRPVLTVVRQPTLFNMYRRWEVFSQNSTSRTDLLFAAVVQPTSTCTSPATATGTPTSSSRAASS